MSPRNSQMGDELGKVVKYNLRTHASCRNILTRDRNNIGGREMHCRMSDKRKCARNHKICMWEP